MITLTPVREMKSEVEDLGNKMDGKIDRLLYAIVCGFATSLLKGGFDS